MVFSSYVFLFAFLPAALAGFWLAARVGHQAARLWLCAASLVFYGWWDIRWVPVLLVSVVANYAIGGRLIALARAARPTARLLAAGVAANLGALFWYKYFLAVVNFWHLPAWLPVASGLPLGISFFTFTQIAFLVDATQGFRDRYSFPNYLLFVTFFPHLIAGPIVHHRDLMPQFEEERTYRLRPRELAIGLAIFAIGLAKKTALADSVALLAQPP